MVRIKPLVAALDKMGMSAVAVTDQSNFFALVKFYQKAQEKGIKLLVAVPNRNAWYFLYR